MIAKEMKDKSVSLTTDLSTSCTMDPYISITAHDITDTWKLKSRVLCTTVMPERHTAVNIAKRLKETIEEWDLIVFCTTHVNASSMNLAMELCKQFPHHLGCAGHSLQLAIKAGLKLPEISKTTNAATRVVSHFCHSAVAHCALKQCQEQLGVKVNKLQNDRGTRWSSTFIMLQRLYEQQLPMKAVLADETVTKVNVIQPHHERVPVGTDGAADLVARAPSKGYNHNVCRIPLWTVCHIPLPTESG